MWRELINIIRQDSCLKCGKRLGWFSIKYKFREGFVCCSCFERITEENKKTMREYIQKYLSDKDNNFRYSAIFNVYEQSRSNDLIVFKDGVFFAKQQLNNKLENLKRIRRGDDIDKIISQKKLFENCLVFLDDLEKLYKLFVKKGIETDCVTILAMFSEIIESELKENITPYFEQISEALKGNVNVENVLREFIKIWPGLESDSVKIPALLQALLHKFGLSYNREEARSIVNKIGEETNLEQFEKNLESESGEQKKKMPQSIEIGDFTNLDGHQFEKYMQNVFELLGYIVVRLPLSGDQGADLIIARGDEKKVVQVKKHTETISNKAIQEVVAAKFYYKADKAMVVTNSLFTKGAIDLALANDVELWDGQKLENVIKELKIPKGEQNLFGVEYEKTIYAALAFLDSPEELEIFKIVITEFLDPNLNLDSSVFQEPSQEFVEKRNKFESASEYVYLIDFRRKSYKNVSEYTADISKLQELLRNKGFDFSKQELNRLLHFESRKQGYLVFKKLMLSYPTSSLRDYLENFVILYKNEISVLKDFRRVHLYIAQNNYFNPKDRLQELERQGIDISSFENQMCFTRGLEMNFDSEKNVRQFIIGFHGPIVWLISNLKKLLSENKVGLMFEDGEQLNNEELIKMIVNIKYSEIKDYNVKKSSLREFKVLKYTVFSLDLIAFLESKTKEDALKEMVSLFARARIIKNSEKFYQNIIDAEKIVETALGQNIAIPNASSDVSENMMVAVGKSREGIDFNSLDGSLVKLVFMVAWNDEIFGDNPGPRLKILAEISRLLKDKFLRESLINASFDGEIFLILRETFQNK